MCGMIDKKERLYWIWFSRIEGINAVQKRRLLEKFKSPKKIWELNYEDLIKFGGITEICIKELLNEKYRNNLEEYEKYLNNNHIDVITMFDDEYPKRLRSIFDMPVVLFAKGNTCLLQKGGVSIVGCRKCSSYGRETARKLAYDLAKEGECIISGLARGIDKYAHIGALEANGTTIAVMGNGLDYIYPCENIDLHERILKNNGLIVTEYIIGTKPSRFSFPARNRIISGLADGVVIVEAKEKSGALITADFGLEQGKEVFAVPGNVNSINSFGTNELIKQGASVVTSYEDVIRELNGKK